MVGVLTGDDWRVDLAIGRSTLQSRRAVGGFRQSLLAGFRQSLLASFVAPSPDARPEKAGQNGASAFTAIRSSSITHVVLSKLI